MGSILSNIASALTIILVIAGVIFILLIMHFLSTYFKNKDERRYYEHDLENLRREANKSAGVSKHSLFYSFFFREK